MLFLFLFFCSYFHVLILTGLRVGHRRAEGDPDRLVPEADAQQGHDPDIVFFYLLWEEIGGAIGDNLDPSGRHA